MKKISDEVKAYLASIGAKGGKRTGEKKKKAARLNAQKPRPSARKAKNEGTALQKYNREAQRRRRERLRQKV